MAAIFAVVCGAASGIAGAANVPPDRAIAGVLNGFVKPGEPGCTVGVVQDGALIQALAFGLADLEHGRPLDSHSIVDLASVSKQFTAFALLLLQQDGKLSLDDPVVRYLPELAASAKGVTLRHLVHHTGGLRDYIAMLYMGGRGDADGTTIDETVRLLARQTRPNAEPGVEYEYSNTGYFLLGVVIARVSGQSLAQFSEERIFRPLGMKNTYIADSHPDGTAALARGYANTDRGFVIDETGWEQVGDGQVRSNLHDLAVWDENFHTAKLGGRELIGQMTQAGVLNSGERLDYAAGLVVGTTRGLPTVRHGGSWVGYRSQLIRFPEERLSVIVLCNRADADSWTLASEVAAVYLGDRMGPPEPEEEEEAAKPAAPVWLPKDLARYAGDYYSVEANVHCRLYLVAGTLIVEGCARGARLAPGSAPGEFADADGSFSLRFPDGGVGTGGFTYDEFGLRGLTFKRVQELSE